MHAGYLSLEGILGRVHKLFIQATVLVCPPYKVRLGVLDAALAPAHGGPVDHGWRGWKTMESEEVTSLAFK